MGRLQVLQLWIRMDPEIMAMLASSILPLTPGLESHYQMHFSVISKTHFPSICISSSYYHYPSFSFLLLLSLSFFSLSIVSFSISSHFFLLKFLFFRLLFFFIFPLFTVSAIFLVLHFHFR